MLTTLTLSQTETQAWAADAQLRTAARQDAARAAVRHGRRFYQVQGADGRVLAVGENRLTAAT